MYQGVAIYGTVSTTAIDVAPDVWYGVAVIIEGDGIGGSSRSIGNVNDGIAIDSTYLLIECSLRLRQTLTATIYRTEDVAADDIHQGTILVCTIGGFRIQFAGFWINLGFSDWLVGIISRISFWTNVSHISTAKDPTIDLSLIRHLHHGTSVDTGYILEGDTISCFRCYTGTTAEYITIDIGTIDMNFGMISCLVTSNLSGGIVFGLVRITESATIYTVKEGITCYGNLGTSGYDAGISATQDTEDGEVRNTLGVVEDWEGSGIGIAVGTGAFARFTGGGMRASQLLCTVINLCIIDAIITFYVHDDFGTVYLGVFTISTSEDREVRVVVVIIRFFPFGSFQQFEWSHTFQHLYEGGTSDVAGKVSTAIDVVRVEEMRLGAGGISTIEFVLIGLILCWIPFDELCLFCICCIPNLVPDDIDGEVVYLLSVIAFYLSTHILCQGYVGIARNIGRSEIFFIRKRISILIGDVTLSATEYLSGKVSGIDIDIGTAFNLCQIAAAIDIAIDIRSLLGASGEGDVGVSDDLSYRFW